jgi:two-component system OmpR family sensor kinase
VTYPRAVGPLRDRWDRTPLRVRLTAAVLLLVAGSLLLISVSTIVALHAYFLDNVDEELENRLKTYNPYELLRALEGENQDAAELGIRPDQYIFSSVYPNGSRIDRPPDRANAPAFTLEDLETSHGKAFTALSADGSDRWRVYALPMTQVGSERDDYDPDPVFDPDDAVFVVLSYNLAHFDKTVASLVWVDILVGGGVLAGLAAVGVALVRASLSPLRQIENTAAMIAAGNYSRRVPERDPSTEVGRVGYAINSMLRKIENSIHARERSEERARDSEQRMRDFIADASHELRTPLTSVRGYAELVRTNPQMPEAERQRYIGQIEDAAKRMGLLVGDLLQLARLDQERPVQTEPVDLAVLAHEAVLAQAVVADDHGFEFKLDEHRSVVVAADRARLRQVLDNLLSNAVRHTPPGTMVTVDLRVEEPEEGRRVAVLNVADDGPGMKAEVAARVFERFFRSESGSVVGRPAGSGLGLSIVAAIVKAHGGTVAVASEPGEGTVFTVRLDLDRESEAPALKQFSSVWQRAGSGGLHAARHEP